MTEAAGTQVEQQATQQGQANAAGAGQSVAAGGAEGAENGSAATNAGADPFAELEADNREWLGKANIKDVKSLGKLAHEQAKRLGSSITLPGKDAKPEEIEAFHEKLGVPKDVDGYELKVPDKLPENLPYDAERANSFKALAKKAGLTKAQAALVHDWGVENAVNDFNGASEAAEARKVETAKAETAKLVKLYGPLDGETMKANMTFADKVLNEGGPEVLEAFQNAGLIGKVGDAKVVQNASIATWLAKVGMGLFKEDTIPAGGQHNAKIGNVFDEKSESFNLTTAMAIVKENPELAKSYIIAAGAKPEDFGLKG